MAEGVIEPDTGLSLSSRFGSSADMERPIRLLTFTTLFPNSVQPNHGVFVENRLRHLIGSRKAESVVVAPVPYFPSSMRTFGRWGRYASVEHREERYGITVYHPRFAAIPRIGMAASPILLAAGTIGFISRLQGAGGDFDLIDAHYLYPDGVAAVWIGKRLGYPVVLTARGSDVNLIPRYPQPRRMIRWAIRESAGLIAVSAALKGALIDLGAAPERVRVLRNGVDLSLFRPSDDRAAARDALGLSHRTLLSVGHLIKRKGHDHVIEAMRQLPEFALLIVGEGTERRELERLSQKLGVADRVRFLGAIPHRDLPQIYTAADALVLASSREGWPNVLLESMACGTPVIASNIWGNPEVVHAPEAGVLMNRCSPDGIISAVRSLFDNLPSRAAVRAYAEQYSWDDTTKGQIALFSEILET
jgi:teichuronic acid biosynthesis glycosyltransferase TuaC